MFPLKEADAPLPPAEAPAGTREEAPPSGAADREDIARPRGEAIGEGEAREEASPPNPSDSKQRKGYWTRRAVDELWPPGVPEEVPNKTIVREVAKYANDKTRKWTIGGPDTILRAAGRKK